MIPPFHLAFPVSDLERTRAFYVELLGCGLGRESDRWIDFDFFGHQLTAHLSEAARQSSSNSVDSQDVPVPHFGAILPWEQWHTLADSLVAAGVRFRIKPYLRFEGEVGEQATMFFDDPSGNPIELKSFKDPSTIFQNEKM
ncbi:MAG: VOC family protein [Myxococcota bacterium]